MKILASPTKLLYYNLPRSSLIAYCFAWPPSINQIMTLSVGFLLSVWPPWQGKDAVNRFYVFNSMNIYGEPYRTPSSVPNHCLSFYIFLHQFVKRFWNISWWDEQVFGKVGFITLSISNGSKQAFQTQHTLDLNLHFGICIWSFIPKKITTSRGQRIMKYKFCEKQKRHIIMTNENTLLLLILISTAVQENICTVQPYYH